MNTNENKFAFVTGTSSGIGKATAEELLKRGWKVVGVSRRDPDLGHKNYKHLNVDLKKIENFDKELSEYLEPVISNKNYNRIALVNNAAGTGEMLRLEELDPLELMDLFKVNLIAPVYLMGLFLKYKPNNTKLRIISLSTGAAHNAYLGMTPYCASKAALLMSVKVFALENSNDKNLAIRSYEPGTVDTEMQLQARSQSPDKFPSVDIFKSIKANNKLVKPGHVAIKIVDFLENNEPGFSEKRLE